MIPFSTRVVIDHSYSVPPRNKSLYPGFYSKRPQSPLVQCSLFYGNKLLKQNSTRCALLHLISLFCFSLVL